MRVSCTCPRKISNRLLEGRKWSHQWRRRSRPHFSSCIYLFILIDRWSAYLTDSPLLNPNTRQPEIGELFSFEVGLLEKGTMFSTSNLFKESPKLDWPGVFNIFPLDICESMCLLEPVLLIEIFVDEKPNLFSNLPVYNYLKDSNYKLPIGEMRIRNKFRINGIYETIKLEGKEYSLFFRS